MNRKQNNNKSDHKIKNKKKKIIIILMTLLGLSFIIFAAFVLKDYAEIKQDIQEKIEDNLDIADIYYSHYSDGDGNRLKEACWVGITNTKGIYYNKLSFDYNILGEYKEFVITNKNDSIKHVNNHIEITTDEYNYYQKDINSIKPLLYFDIILKGDTPNPNISVELTNIKISNDKKTYSSKDVFKRLT